MERFLLVCLGSAVGGGARYLISGWAHQLLGSGFPHGTFVVNLLGSYLLGALMFAGVEVSTIPPAARIALTTGVMGGFTTFSTFSYETLRHLQDGAWAIALLNVALSVVGCLLACWLGWSSARSLLGA
jgi:CrcB protein